MTYIPLGRYSVQSDSLLMVSSIHVLLNDALYNYTGWFNIFSVVGDTDARSSSSSTKNVMLENWLLRLPASHTCSRTTAGYDDITVQRIADTIQAFDEWQVTKRTFVEWQYNHSTNRRYDNISIRQRPVIITIRRIADDNITILQIAEMGRVAKSV